MRKSRDHRRRSRQKDSITHSKWMKWSIYFLIIYAVTMHWTSQPLHKRQAQPLIKAPSISHENEEKQIVRSFTPSRITTIKGEGKQRLRCGDNAIISYTFSHIDGSSAEPKNVTLTIGSPHSSSLLSQMSDGMQKKEVRQIIIDAPLFKTLHPEETTTAKVAITLQLISFERAPPKGGYTCNLTSAWQKAIKFR